MLLGVFFSFMMVTHYCFSGPRHLEVKILLAFEGFFLPIIGLLLANTVPIVVGATLAHKRYNLATGASSLVVDCLILGVAVVFWGVVWVQQAYDTAVEVSPAADIVLPLVFLAYLPFDILEPLAFAVVAGQGKDGEESSDRG